MEIVMKPSDVAVTFVESHRDYTTILGRCEILDSGLLRRLPLILLIFDPLLIMY